MGELTGITPVARPHPPAGGDRCRPWRWAFRPARRDDPGLSLAAPCNRGERIVAGISGLSFSVRTQGDGHASVTLPALRSDAMVAVYLQDARLVLGKVTVPDASRYSRFAVVWELPAEAEARVTDGGRC